MPLHTAAAKENLDDLEKALANGSKPDELNEHGQAPLHVLATKSFRNEGTLPCIEALLKAGADINLRNKEGFTPLQVAAQSGWQDTVAYLFQKGAKLDKEMMKEMHVKCPDCIRVLAQFEKDDFHVLNNYEFENKHITKTFTGADKHHANHAVAGLHGDSNAQKEAAAAVDSKEKQEHDKAHPHNGDKAFEGKALKHKE